MQIEFVHLLKFGVTNGFKTQEPMAFEITDIKHGVTYWHTIFEIKCENHFQNFCLFSYKKL